MTRYHSDLVAALGTSPEKAQINRNGKDVAVKRSNDGTVEITIPKEISINKSIEHHIEGVKEMLLIP